MSTITIILAILASLGSLMILCLVTRQTVMLRIAPRDFEIFGLYINSSPKNCAHILIGMCFMEGWRTGLIRQGGHVYIENMFSITLP
jgi:hypothetical protein